MIRYVPSARIGAGVTSAAACGWRSTTLPMWRAWAMNRNAAWCSSRSNTVSGSSASAPEAAASTTSATTARIRAGSAVAVSPQSITWYSIPAAAASCSPTRSRLPISRNRPPRPSRAMLRADELAGQRVEHDVDAAGVTTARAVATAEVGADPVGEAEVAGVVDVGDTEPAQQVALGIVAGGGDDLGAGAQGEVDRGHPHPAGPGVDEHALPGAQPPDGVEREAGGDVRDEQPGRGLEAELRRLAHDEVGRAGDVRAEAARCDGDDGVADGEPLDVRPGGDHHARQLPAERPRIAGVHAERVEHVLEVEPTGVDPDLDLARPRRPAHQRAQGEVVEGAALGDGELDRRRRAPVVEVGQPGCERARAAQRELVLAPVGEQLVDEAAHLRRVAGQLRRGVDVEAARRQLGVLERDGAGEPPHRGRDRVGERPARRLRAAASPSTAASPPRRRSAPGCPPAPRRARPDRRARTRRRHPAPAPRRRRRSWPAEPRRHARRARRRPRRRAGSTRRRRRATPPSAGAAVGAPATSTACTVRTVTGPPVGAGSACASVKPSPVSSRVQPAASSSSECGRSSRSLNRHQPSVSPNVIEMNRCAATISTITSRPPGASRRRTWASVWRRSVVAWSTLAAMTTSNCSPAKPCASRSASMSSVR